MEHSLYATLEVGQMYFTSEEMETVSARGHALVNSVRQREISPDDAIRQAVREYLELHGRTMGSGGISAKRLSFYDGLDGKTIEEIVDWLEQLINISLRMFHQVQTVSDAFVAELRQTMHG